jgi:SPX domain protein involved in polyphosphate accumulation
MGFRIQATYTRMNGGTDTQMWNVAANATTAQVSFVAGGINPVVKACFAVTAFNGPGDSLPSNEVCAVL